MSQFASEIGAGGNFEIGAGDEISYGVTTGATALDEREASTRLTIDHHKERPRKTTKT
jgi:hypothetical protein